MKSSFFYLDGDVVHQEEEETDWEDEFWKFMGLKKCDSAEGHYYFDEIEKVSFLLSQIKMLKFKNLIIFPFFNTATETGRKTKSGALDRSETKEKEEEEEEIINKRKSPYCDIVITRKKMK